MRDLFVKVLKSIIPSTSNDCLFGATSAYRVFHSNASRCRIINFTISSLSLETSLLIFGFSIVQAFKVSSSSSFSKIQIFEFEYLSDLTFSTKTHQVSKFRAACSSTLI